MAFVEDLTLYFAEYGSDATLDGQAVRIVFDTPADLLLDQRAAQPQATLRTAQVPAQPFDKVLVVPGQGSFAVRDHVPDGTGMSVLILTRQP